jgi:phenylpropionate dioxygenase-like ring-hydroxylating dioxygenase large terminal subunit
MRGKELLHDLWYLALPARGLTGSKLVGKTILAEDLLFGRRADGRPFAIRDRCPHRGMPLRHGRLEGDAVECSYHGWKFGTGDGRCTAIPSLTEQDAVRVDRIGVPTYPCREVAGAIWVYVAKSPRDVDETKLPPIPGQEHVTGIRPFGMESREFPCHVDWAAIGLMDPAHAAFVHTSWWWRTGKRVLREKEKQFGPFDLGYRMGPFEMKQMARPYRLLGDVVTVEITFVLPGVRVEVLRGDKAIAVDLTAITPVDEERTEVHHAIYTTARRVRWAKPIARRFIRTFLEQDRDVVVRQHEGIVEDESMMFVGDADQEARWYFALKKEYLDARAEGRAFRNPVEATTLRWKS